MKESMENWLFYNNVKYSVDKVSKPNSKLSKDLYNLSRTSNLLDDAKSQTADTQQTPAATDTTQAPVAPSATDTAQAPVTPAATDTAQAPVTPAATDTAQAPIAPAATDTSQAPIAPAATDTAQAPIAPAATDTAQAPIAPAATDTAQAPIAPAATDTAQAPIAPAATDTAQAPVAPAGNLGAYLREHQNQNTQSGIIDPSGASWRSNYGQVAPGFFNGQNNQSSQTEAATNPQMPANDGFNRFNKGVVDPKGTTWRGNYGQVAPGFFNGQHSTNASSDTTPQNAQAQAATEASNNPNQNGAQSNGPTWKPNTSSPGWNAPQPYSNLGANPANNKQFQIDNLLVNQALQTHVSYLGNLVAGGIGGTLAAGPLPWTFGKVTEYLQEHGPSEKVRNIAEKAHNKFDPAQVYKRKYDNTMAKIATDDKVIEDLKTRTNDELTNLSELAGKGDFETATRIKTLQERLSLLSDNKFSNSEDAARQIKLIRLANKNNPDLFTKDELDAIESRTVLRNEAQATLKEFDNSTKFFGESSVRGVLNNFIKGAAFAGISMAANDYADRLLGVDQHMGNYLYNGLMLPAAFALSDSWGKRIALAGAGIVAGYAIDKALPETKKQEFTTFLKPSTFGSLLMGASFLLPADSTATRAALVGGAWALNGVYNYFNSGDLGIKTAATDSLKTDAKTMDYQSMQNAIEKFKKLGDTNLMALNLPVQQLNSVNSNDLEVLRQQAIVDAAYGESLLKQGTIEPGAKTPQYLLPGYNYDLGGRAMRYLVLADIKLGQASQIAKLNVGKDVDGHLITQQQVDDLQKENVDIQNIINNKINGQHDINAIFNQLEKLTMNHTHTATELIIKNQNWISKLGNSEPKLTAKLFRDLALLEMANAAKTIGYNGIGKQYPGALSEAAISLYGSDEARQNFGSGNNPKGYSGALDCIKLASKLDPNNPDLPAIIAIANKLTALVPQNSISQSSVSLDNPVGTN